MNARTISILLAAAALGTLAPAPLSGAPTNDRPVAYTVQTLVDSSDISVNIKRGAPREYVSWAMRYKTREELSPDVWAFFSSANDKGCANLIITFANGKVVAMQLVNKCALNALAASLRLGSPASNIASK
jgi:hypothetical protein